MVAVTLFMGKLLAPNHPNPEKLSSYECGEEPTGSAWIPFNSRFYVIALVFLLFDVEMVFIIPWATVFGNRQLIATDARWGVYSLIEMFVFLGILILGLAYVWRKGDLDWIKPNPHIPQVNSIIPFSLYDQLNKEQSNFKVKKFNSGTEAPQEAIPAVAPSPAPVKKHAFKPAFKKPVE